MRESSTRDPSMKAMSATFSSLLPSPLDKFRLDFMASLAPISDGLRMHLSRYLSPGLSCLDMLVFIGMVLKEELIGAYIPPANGRGVRQHYFDKVVERGKGVEMVVWLTG